MKRRIVYGIVWLTLTGLIVFTSLNTGETYSAIGGSVGAWINAHFFANALTAFEVKSLTGFGSKFIGHFLLFAMDGLFADLFLRCFPSKSKRNFTALLLVGIVLSCLGEGIQIFVAGRFPSVEDIVINLSGFMSLPMVLALYRSDFSRVGS